MTPAHVNRRVTIGVGVHTLHRRSPTAIPRTLRSRAAPKSPEVLDEDLAFRLEHYDRGGGSAGHAVSPGMAYLQERWFNTCANAGTAGAMAAISSTMQSNPNAKIWTYVTRASIGFYTGWSAANTTFWMYPPDTSRFGGRR